jgi:protein MpaA
MNAIILQRATPERRPSRSISELLAPLEEIAGRSASLVENRGARFEVEGAAYELPRYLFIGPQGGDAPLRVGLFAGIHGDKSEGPNALVRFVRFLEAYPEMATGYALSIYPLCNPTGFEDRTRHSRRGKDLNREFWKNTDEPEVRLLQAEMISRCFQGIISLHADDTGQGFYGMVRGATLTRHLIEPALAAAEDFLPRDERAVIDGFEARKGIVLEGCRGMLSAPPKVRPRPFEIVLKTPGGAAAFLKECAMMAALLTILTEYRKFIAYAPNL